MGCIIHVDSSKFFRKMMKLFLTELGLESLDFERGEDALLALSCGKVSCMITGLELPDMKGEELIRKLDLEAYPMTVIAVTASTNDDRTCNLASLGVKGIIQKGGNWKEKLREYF